MATSIYNKELWTSGCSATDPVCTLSTRPSSFFVDNGHLITTSVFYLKFNNKVVGIQDIEYITSLEGIEGITPKQCQLLAPEKRIPVVLSNSRHQHAYWAIIPLDGRNIMINTRFWTHCFGVVGGKATLVRRHPSYGIEIRSAGGGCGVFWGNERLSVDNEVLIWNDVVTNSVANTFVIVPTGKSLTIDIDLDPYDMSQFFNSSVLVTSMINGRRYNFGLSGINISMSFDEDVNEYKEWNVQSASWTNENNVLYEVLISDEGLYLNGDINKREGVLYLTEKESSFYLLVLPDRQVALLKGADESLSTIALKEKNSEQPCVLHKTTITTNWTFSFMKDYVPVLFNLDPRV